MEKKKMNLENAHAQSAMPECWMCLVCDIGKPDDELGTGGSYSTAHLLHYGNPW